MDEAKNFGDFTRKLCDRVCSQPSSPLLEYFATLFAFHIYDYSLIERLKASGKISDMAKPLFLISKVQRGKTISWKRVKNSLDKALKSTPNDWIACYLYLRIRLLAEQIYPECDIDFRPIEIIRRRLSKNKELEFFNSYILIIQAWISERETKYKEMIELLNQAIILARDYDEQILVAYLLNLLANQTKRINVRKAIDILHTASELSEQLGYQFNIGANQHEWGHIMGIRGELSAAIEYHLEYLRITESLAFPDPIQYAVIAVYLNLSGNGKKALKFAKTAVELNKSYPRLAASVHAQKVYALINLGRYEEAEAELEVTHELATKSGASHQLRWYSFVEGLFEKAEGRFENAIECFREYLKIDEEIPITYMANACLLNLTDIEITRLTDERLRAQSDSSGPWMNRLFEHAEMNELPGVTAQALLLKAKLRQRQGRYKEVTEILRDVQRMAERPSMKFLNDLMVSSFPDIILS